MAKVIIEIEDQGNDLRTSISSNVIPEKTEDVTPARVIAATIYEDLVDSLRYAERMAPLAAALQQALGKQTVDA